MTKPRLIAHICDVHVPEHDGPLWATFLRWCRDVVPDEVVIGGDFLELGSCSSHGGVVDPPALLDDVKHGRRCLEQLRAACPKASIVYLEGNHETRLTRKVISDLPALHGAVDIPSLLGLKDLGISWLGYGKVLVRGKLGIVHGVYTQKHHAAKHLDRYKRSIAYGHTHRPQIYIDGCIDSHGNNSVSGAFGAPCMRGLDVDWTVGPHGWVQGFNAYYLLDDGCFTPYMVLANRGRFAWNGKVYGKAPAKHDDEVTT